MDKLKNKLLLLTTIGLTIVALSQIIWHYLELPDFLNGALIGVGLGLMFIAIFKRRKKQFSKDK
jgi:hypothetical protein